MNCKLFLLYFWANVALASIRDLTITTQHYTVQKFEVEMQQLIRINVNTLQPIIIVVV